MEGGGQEKPENLSSEEEDEELEAIDEDVVQLTGEEIEGLEEGMLMVEEEETPSQWTDFQSEAAQQEEKEYDPSQDNYLVKYSGHKDAVLCIEPLLHGLVASGDCQQKLHVWRRDTGEQIKVIEDFKDSVIKIKLSPNGNQIATASLDNAIRIYKFEVQEQKSPEATGEEEKKSQNFPGKVNIELQHIIQGPSEEIEFLEWHSSGKVLLTGGKDKAAWLFSAISGNYLQIFNGHSQQLREGLFTLDGKSVVTIALDKKLKVWNPKTGNIKLTVESSGKDQFHSAGITCMIFSLEGDTVFSGDQSGAIFQSSWKSGKIFGCLCSGFQSEEEDDQSHSIESLSVKHVGEQRWLASGSMDAHLRCFETSKGIKWSDIELTVRNPYRQSGVIKIKFLQAGLEAHLIAALVDGRIILADMKAGETLKAFKGHQDTVLDFAIDEGDKRILSSGDDEKCLVFQFDIPLKK